MGILSLPENFKIVSATAGPVTTNGGITCDYISLKNAVKVWIVASIHNAAAHASVVAPTKATAVAGTGVVAVTSSYKIWSNLDVSLTDTLVARTAAVSYAVDAGVTNKLVVIEIDCQAADWNGTAYDVLGCGIATSGQATNFADILYIVEPKYQQATPPTQITD